MAKLMISMPDDLLRRVDARARRRRMTRSGFLQAAAERELEVATRDEIERALRDGQEALAGIGAFDSADLIREDRDSRKR